MVRIIRHFPDHQPNDGDNDRSFEREKPRSSSSAEDAFDDLLAGLTHRPDVVTPLPASRQAALPHAAANEPGQAKLPSVEEFRFEDIAAKNMANKLAPEKKPRVKTRRPRYRSPNRDRWNSPDDTDGRQENGTGGRRVSAAVAANRGRGRGLIWTFFASVLVILGTSAAFGFVQPLNDLLPQRIGDFLGGFSSNLTAGLSNRGGTPADMEVAGINPNSDKDIVISRQPASTAVVARQVSTMTIKAEVQPAASNSKPGFSEQAAAADISGGEAFGSDAEPFKIVTAFGAPAKMAAPETAIPAIGPTPPIPSPAAPAAEAPADIPPPVAAPVETAAPVAAAAVDAPAPAAPAAVEGSENAPRKVVLQRSAKADPLADTPAIGDNPVAGAVPGIAPSAVTSLSPAQIERLLERGKGLLENGDIASARLLFLRVAAAGDGRGARGVGMTYDPSVYARLPVAGLTPDRAQAEFWYKKAGDTASFVLELKTPPAAEPVKPQAQQSAAWRAACARKYKSFVPSTGLYTALSGAKRRCVLP